jgi:hypothetical protein
MIRGIAALGRQKFIDEDSVPLLLDYVMVIIEDKQSQQTIPRFGNAVQ